VAVSVATTSKHIKGDSGQRVCYECNVGHDTDRWRCEEEDFVVVNPKCCVGADDQCCDCDGDSIGSVRGIT